MHIKSENNKSLSKILAFLNKIVDDVLKKGGFATKDDLKRFATKDDLKRFATKDDLDKYVTKNYLDSRLDDQKEEIIEEFRSFRSDFYTKIDPILKEIKANEEDRAALSAQFRRHEDRIENLEKIHPQGAHFATI